MPPSVAVVGAGAAGAATATVLDDVADVTIFEREVSVGGRGHSREREGCRYEIGANYLTPTDDAVEALLEKEVSEETLVELDGDIWTFDGNGDVTEGDDAANSNRRVTCRKGLDTLVHRLLADTDSDVELETRVDALVRTDGSWRVEGGEGEDHGTFDAVVLTPPAPLTADVLGRSEWSHPDCRNVREAVASVPYRPITSVVLHYPFELDRPWYALVNDDREHPIGWIAREDTKPGYVPEGETVLLVQCSSDFTIEHYDADDGDVVEKAAMLTAGLLGEERLVDPDWSDQHCWRYAVPEAGVDRNTIACTTDHDLYVAGDWVVGEDRLNGALRSGLDTGETVRDDLF